MKRYIVALFIGLVLSTSVLADTTIPWTKAGCESAQGKWITAHSATDTGCDAAHCNGLHFCKSSQEMNWFSALIWCKSLGHKLTDLDTACPNGLSSGNTCANLKNTGLNMGAGGYWVDMPSPTTAGRSVFVTEDKIYLDHNVGNRNGSRYVLCKE